MSRKINIRPALLLSAIINADGFMQRAARKLGVSRLAVMRRLRERGLDGKARELRAATGWTIGRPR